MLRPSRLGACWISAFSSRSLAIRRSRFPPGCVLNLTAAEDHGALHLVARLEEALGLTDPHVVIVLINLVAHLDLLDFGLVRLLLGLFGFLFLLELELAVVHDPADRWVSLLAHQHQIQFPVAGHIQGFFAADHAS